MSAVFIFVTFLFWNFSVADFECTESQMHISTVEGHTTVLFCESDLDDENSTVMWSKDNHTLEASAHIKMQGQLLWIFSTTSSDGGLYICQSANSSSSKQSWVFLSVEAGPCPTNSDIDLALEESNVTLSCTKERIPLPGQRLQVWWWKECKSTGIQGSELSLSNVSMSNKGNYTCLVMYRYEDKNYTASQTYQLIVMRRETVSKPRVLEPRNQSLHVNAGEELKLECIVDIGREGNSEYDTSVYWMINHTFIEIYPDLQQNLTIEKRENSKLYGNLTLFILKVLPEFYGVPFQCIVFNPRGEDMGQVWLSQDDNTNQSRLVIVLLVILAIAVGAVLLKLFKIDLILAYRHLCGKDQTTQERSLYNAYVLYLSGNKCCGSSTVEDLALRILPEILEQKHHLNLFVQGRDTDSEVNIATITDVLNRSKVVVIILPYGSEEEHLMPLGQDQNRLAEPQLSVLFSNIAQSGIPLVLIECGENADYSLLPESIQSIIKKERVLKWKPTVQPKGRFWKRLRYHMT